jgi:hypothetical protein
MKNKIYIFIIVINITFLGCREKDILTPDNFYGEAIPVKVPTDSTWSKKLTKDKILSFTLKDKEWELKDGLKFKMKLISNKFKTYEITPYIIKSSLIKLLDTAELTFPNRGQYGGNYAYFVVENGKERYPIPYTFSFLKDDDNNPSTTDPFMAQFKEEEIYSSTYVQFADSTKQGQPQYISALRGGNKIVLVNGVTFTFKMEIRMLNLQKNGGDQVANFNFTFDPIKELENQ